VPHQVALTVVAPLRAGARPQLDAALDAAGSSGGEAEMPFAKLTGVHFARIFVLDEDVAADGTHTGQKLVWMSDVDAPLERHLDQLCGLAGPALDRLLCHCEGYPDATDAGGRRAYLDAHTVSAAAAYVNSVGRGLEQVLLERSLREAIEGYLDDHRDRLSGLGSVAAREEIQRFVAGDEALSRALSPPAPLEPAFRFREIAHMVLIPVLLVLLLPLILVALPFFAILLRIHERRDVPDDQPPDDAHTEALAAREDHSIQNPFIAAGSIKGGRFRLMTTVLVLWVADYVVRHIFNRANLAGVKTIHFARWVFLDGRRRVVFASSYDGSVESYMDDFIDKVWWGLNAVFSNGIGYPRTRWLVLGGARDERAFKRILRRRQEPVQLWYSAYPDMTARNVRNNQDIRAGLAGSMSDRQASEWMARL
jgi:hypothetical protein